MKKRGWLLGLCLCCLLLGGCYSGKTEEGPKQENTQQVSGEAKSSEAEEDSHITMVKNGCPSNYPDSPYGDVFEKFFEDPAWAYFQAEDEQDNIVDIVEFTGECEFEKADYEAQIQFTLDVEDHSFEATYLALDGEAQTMTMLHKLLAKVYEKEGPAVSGEVGIPAKEVPATTATEVAQAPTAVLEAENNYYILPYSSSYPLMESDIRHLTKSQLRLARNEIYARHGRIFQDDGLQNYFNSQAWYTPIYTSDEFSDSWLSDVEAGNIEFIKSYE